MAIKLKELVRQKELLTGGHRLCAGCGASVAVRQVLHALPENVHAVTCSPTGCLEVSTTIYPYNAWRISFIHSAFENAAATISGVETAYRALKKKGKISEDFRFIVFGGDGGTYDIGFQAFSGLLERGHRAVYVCYNNEAYMNTGIQRSGATQFGAWTTTSPHGDSSAGKGQNRKDLTAIAAAHNIPYVAQAAVHNWRDTITKARKAFQADGPAVLNILAPCHRGWRYPMEQTIEMSKLATQSCIWPLYEVENGTWRLTAKIKEKTPLRDYMKPQGRFAHLFKPGNEGVLDLLQEFVDEQWERLQQQCAE
ncbi:thiamine pyrophosphate-dependent enzyme [Dethiobacter alkaliphilus]|uniref:Thiamine pyrophosphate protein domain protein TPP-binding n=1 Tax=Dethiobacter alkaliphilus AHT 1 TaxID=555088 RepID=C0GFI5_DETAL|nr:thiamine pyrophosphate-dependent enzyme [Dethiobacter alkaliphilus]EEG77945.1 thiamine pyrophosphate protein domain protein TPP-binding [Dethiobacter alkaliphilus AHT 1]